MEENFFATRFRPILYAIIEVPSTPAHFVKTIESPAFAFDALTKWRAKAKPVAHTIGKESEGVTSVCPPTIVAPSDSAALFKPFVMRLSSLKLPRSGRRITT